MAVSELERTIDEGPTTTSDSDSNSLFAAFMPPGEAPPQVAINSAPQCARQFIKTYTVVQQVPQSVDEWLL